MDLRQEQGAIASVLLTLAAVASMVAFFVMHQGDEYRAMAERYRVPRAELTFQLRQILDCTQTPAKNGACPVQRPATIYDINGVKRWDPAIMTFTDRHNNATEYRVICTATKSFVLQVRKPGTTAWAKAEGLTCP